MRYAVTDVHYFDTSARAALVLSEDPRFAGPLTDYTTSITDVAPYVAGKFFERELPALSAVMTLAGPIDLLIVDGYTDLDPGGLAGLGAHARRAFDVPVIGIAKTPYRTATHAARVHRGTSRHPLYVTATDMPLADAAAFVLAMTGPHRLPDALRRADHLARGLILPNAPPRANRINENPSKDPVKH